MSTPDTKSHPTARHRKVAALCAGFALGMLGLAFASVPLYDLFCRVTGYGGTTQRAEVAPTEILDRTVTVRFDANTSPGLAWRFEPLSPPMTVKLGETAVAIYRATNISDRPTTGTSTFNVVPDQAGVFFNKLECFCFQEQLLEPGQSIDMPVQFFVDPAMVQDNDGRRIYDITLSYTFFAVAVPRQASADKLTKSN